MTREPRAPRRPDDERAPLFARWSTWYGLVAGVLALVILFCGWLTAHNG